MEKKILYNVIDIRTGKYHSVAVVTSNHTLYFIPADEYEKAVEQQGE